MSVAESPSPVVSIPDDPRKDVVWGSAVALAFFVVLMGGAAFARMDAATYAHGVVTVSGNRQAVQSRDGGVVSGLNVREGDTVKAGQVLIELSSGDLSANERALTRRLVALEATRARLIAEQRGLSIVPVPPEFADLSPQDRALGDIALKLEQKQMASRLTVLGAQQNVLSQRVQELEKQIDGYGKQTKSNTEQQRLISEELAGTRKLAEKGYAPVTRVRALERSLAGLQGDGGSLEADTAKTRDQIGEARLQMVSNQRQHVEDAVQQLRDTETQLADTTAKLQTARTELTRAEVRAPASGQVVGLKVFTVGGVIAPGDKLMEIVPQEASLVIEAQIPPDSADELKPGLKAEVRFPSFHQRNMPSLHGVVTKISADSFVDEKSGARFYRAEVSVPPAELAVVRRARGADAGVKPGLPVEVVVPLRKRTALQYLLEPLSEAAFKSFRER